MTPSLEELKRLFTMPEVEEDLEWLESDGPMLDPDRPAALEDAQKYVRKALSKLRQWRDGK